MIEVNKIKRKLKTKFTKWYVRKGYIFGYDGNIPPKPYWNCPWYVKPLLFLFSPSVYQAELGNEFVKGFMEGLQSNIKLEFDNFVAKEGLTNDKL